MKKTLIIVAVILVLVIVFFASGPFFVVTEGQQALVLRFGELRRIETEAGLKLKTPFLENVVYLPKRLMVWDGEPQSIPTKENQLIFVDATARWIIRDPKLFYSSLTTLDRAYARLSDVIDNAVRTVISANFLREAVRNSDLIMTSSVRETFETGDSEGSDALRQLTQTETSFESIDKGRKHLSQEMLNISRETARGWGIEIIDVITRQISYTPDLTESVYSRMIKERNQIAQAFRSYGEGKKAEWQGKLENERRSILSKAYEESERIKGEADATATKIYADAYGRDRSFYEFWRAIESYRQTLPSFSKTLSTNMEYFEYLYGPKGR